MTPVSAGIYAVPGTAVGRFSKRLRTAAEEHTLTIDELAYATGADPRLIRSMIEHGAFFQAQSPMTNDECAECADARFTSEALPYVLLQLETHKLVSGGVLTQRQAYNAVKQVEPYVRILWREIHFAVNEFGAAYPQTVIVRKSGHEIRLSFLRDAAVLWAAAGPAILRRRKQAPTALGRM
jgi:hypothetical protein